MKNTSYKYYETLNDIFITGIPIDKNFEDRLNRFITNYERTDLTKKERIILEILRNLHADYVMCEFYKKENDIINLNKTRDSFRANSKKLKKHFNTSI